MCVELNIVLIRITLYVYVCITGQQEPGKPLEETEVSFSQEESRYNT
jgi:hypothetical protein